MVFIYFIYGKWSLATLRTLPLYPTRGLWPTLWESLFYAGESYTVSGILLLAVADLYLLHLWLWTVRKKLLSPTLRDLKLPWPRLLTLMRRIQGLPNKTRTTQHLKPCWPQWYDRRHSQSPDIPLISVHIKPNGRVIGKRYCEVMICSHSLYLLDLLYITLTNICFAQLCSQTSSGIKQKVDLIVKVWLMTFLV